MRAISKDGLNMLKDCLYGIGHGNISLILLAGSMLGLHSSAENLDNEHESVSVAADADTFRPVTIPKSDPAIINSGTGWHKWHEGYEWGPATASYDVSNRILWRDLEPTRGNYDFTLIEKTLQQAKARGGRALLRFRAVATAGVGMPDYMIELMPKGFMKDWLNNKKPETFAYVPDWNDPDFIERADALLTAIGEKYNDDPRLGIIDIGMYGRWGEWHCAGITYPTKSGALEITQENIKAIIDMHIKAFPDKRLVMMTDHLFALQYALGKSERIGWRRDSYGTDWFQDPERMKIVKDRWKTAPVVAEPIGDFNPGNLKYCKNMEQQAAQFHVATINGINTYKKGLTYSAEEVAAVKAAGKNSGFRFALSQVALPKSILPGEAFIVAATWKNDGSTPAYERWEVIYQLRVRPAGDIVWGGVSSLDLETLLPTGDEPRVMADKMVMPRDIEPGRYDFVVIVKDKETDYRLPLALGMAGRRSDGSYLLGVVEIGSGDRKNGTM